ncbi:MFS general substrate transporter [Thozetella sp. PMI_491]|nr:MFS general substrate transporter [Thozetella sp. PMI_491]
MTAAASATASTLSMDTATTLEEPAPVVISIIPSRLSRAQSRAGQEGDVEKQGQETQDTDTSAGKEQEVRSITGLRWLLVCMALYMSAFLYGLDTTIAADVQGPVIESFGHVEQLAWVGAGFPLGSVAVILFLTSLYSSFNQKWVYIAGIVVFEAGSALCGGAPNMTALIVGRVIAGAGGSAMYLGVLNYIASLTVSTERGLYITLIGFFWAVGAIVGPIIGGAFAVSSATWRWAFYINLVIGAAASPIFFFFLPPIHPVQGVSILSRIAKLDGVGLLLKAGIWVTFTLAFTMAGGQWPWNDGRTITMLVVFGVLVILYVLQQWLCLFTTKETRSFPVELLSSRTQILLYIATAANITSLFVVVYFIPIYFQFVHNDSAIMAAVRLLPYVIIACSINVASGHLLSKIKMYMPIYFVSGVFLTLGGSLLMVYLDPKTSAGTIYGLTVLVAFGTGPTIQIGYAIATINAPAKLMGDAISLQNIAQIGSTVIALVIAGQVYQSSAVENLSAVLDGRGFSQSEIIDAVAGAQSALFGQLTGELRDAAILAVTQAMQKSFSLIIVSGAVILIASLFMKREKLFGDVIVAA